MTYRVDVLPAVQRAIRKLPPDAKRRIQGAIELLAHDPRPPAARKLRDSTDWRVRVGDHRIIYGIDDGRLVVVVVKAAHRQEVYRSR